MYLFVKFLFCSIFLVKFYLYCIFVVYYLFLVENILLLFCDSIWKIKNLLTSLATVNSNNIQL